MSRATMSKTILVVDDDPTIRDVLERYLRREGFAVLTAADGQTALQKAGSEKPDLVVLDLMLPHVDGWEICRRLRAESTVPILMLTARGEEYERILGLGLGARRLRDKTLQPRRGGGSHPGDFPAHRDGPLANAPERGNYPHRRNRR